MNNWAAVLAGLLILMVLLHGAARLWPKRAGYHYLRYNLARRGIKTARIPPECIHAFVSWGRYRAILGRYDLPLAVADCQERVAWSQRARWPSAAA